MRRAAIRRARLDSVKSSPCRSANSALEAVQRFLRVVLPVDAPGQRLARSHLDDEGLAVVPVDRAGNLEPLLALVERDLRGAGECAVCDLGLGRLARRRIADAVAVG